MTQALSNLPDRLPPSDDNPPFPPLGLWSDELPLASDLHREQIDSPDSLAVSPRNRSSRRLKAGYGAKS
jgi:hypothetical protein